MENEENIKKLTPDESINIIFDELSKMSGCFEDDSKKIILGKLKALEEEYTVLEMKSALRRASMNFKEKASILKDSLVEGIGAIRVGVNERLEMRREKKVIKKEKELVKLKERLER